MYNPTWYNTDNSELAPYCFYHPPLHLPLTTHPNPHFPQVCTFVPCMKHFTVPNIYRSPLISAIKNKRKGADRLKKDFTPTVLDFGAVQILLARHFGFCYGVENAIDIAFKTIEANEGKRIFLLSEMIHNPQVNADLKDLGVLFLQDTYGRQVISFDEITGDDVVIIPAFGTTL